MKDVGVKLTNEIVVTNKVEKDNLVHHEFLEIDKHDYSISYSNSVEDNFKKGDILAPLEDTEFIKDIEKIIGEEF